VNSNSSNVKGTVIPYKNFHISENTGYLLDAIIMCQTYVKIGRIPKVFLLQKKYEAKKKLRNFESLT
jgi:hypothetical protein